MAASPAHALGFGRVINATQLGQPLNFAAALHLDNDESVARECVSAEVQSGDNRLTPGQVRATLEGGPDSPDRTVRVTTSTVIDEPVVTVSVTVGCTAKITRKFVAFIDPPIINLAQSGAAPAAAEPTLPPQRDDSQVAPLVNLVEGERPPVARPRPPRTEQGERPPAPRPRARPAPVARSTASADGLNPAPARAPRPAAARRQAKAAARAPASAPAGARLKLEAPPAVVATPTVTASAPVPVPTLPQAPLATAAASAASAAAIDAAAEQLARERERIRLLEDGLNKLRADSQTTQTSVASLQARLKQAESERYANPLVYGLAWLCALLALGLAGLLWRQQRGRSAAQWWAAPGPAPAASGAVAVPAAAPFVPPRRPAAPQPSAKIIRSDPQTEAQTTRAGAFEVPTVIEDEDYPTTLAPYTQPGPFMPTAPMTILPAIEQPARELSVEELIDLEQQAEFFVVLGQDDAAIELLMSHVRSDGGISPLPYLKLLEIYRRRGDTDAYERIRDRFNRRFNAYAPDWDADLQHGRSLEDYPETVSRLQALWATPTRVMETLDASLFRRNKSDETFDLPAYRELLFLFSVARDLAEHGGMLPVGDVDFLLPLSDDPNAEPIERLSAVSGGGSATTTGFESSDMMTLPLDLDITLNPAVRPDAPIVDKVSFESAETLPAALRRGPGEMPADSGFIDFDLDAPYQPPTKPDPKKG
ncbi:MAG TPA: hypothetical protein VGM74_04385 [Burkholderiaceae bacterium]